MKNKNIEPEKPRYAKGRHPNSLKNLIPYPPGVSGHTGTYALKNRLKHALDKPQSSLEYLGRKDAPLGDKIVKATIEGALKRERVPFRELWERVEGKETQPVEASIMADIVFHIGKGYKKAGITEKEVTDPDAHDQA